MNWFKPKKPTRQEKQVLDLQAEIEALKRQITVLEAERDTMAQVLARDRQRVQAEGAAYARKRAEAEGANE